VKTFEYPQTQAGIKRVQLARPLQGLMAASGHGLSLIINLTKADPGDQVKITKKKAAANDPASSHPEALLL
jgi:hypothetical protein